MYLLSASFLLRLFWLTLAFFGFTFTTSDFVAQVGCKKNTIENITIDSLTQNSQSFQCSAGQYSINFLPRHMFMKLDDGLQLSFFPPSPYLAFSPSYLAKHSSIIFMLVCFHSPSNPSTFASIFSLETSPSSSRTWYRLKKHSSEH